MKRILLLAAAAAFIARAATPDLAAIDRHDLERNRQHHAALAERDKDIAALRAELSRLRAAAEQCRDMAPAPKAPSAPDLGGSRGALDR